MRRVLLPLIPLICLAAAVRLGAQGPGAVGGFGTTVRTGPIFEGYYLGSGLAFDHITELTVPVSLSQRVGSRLDVDLATAYASASVRTVGGSDLSLSGLVDTDVRAAFAVIPGRLLLTLVGTLPTGRQTVPDSTVPLFGVLATDLLGFTTPSFGSGGAITGGFATAMRWGDNWAIGAGASYRHQASFTPFSGSGELQPGDEGRARLGVEGPLGGGKYFRGAAIYTVSANDEITGGPSSISGDRVLVYSALNLPSGRGTLSLYGFEMRRLRPRGFTTTYANAIKVPRGNVLSLGARLERPLGPRATLVPNLELRHELTDGPTGLTLLGYLARPGADLRYQLSGQAVLVLQGRLGFGKLEDQGVSVSLLGPQLGALLQWTR